MGGFGRHSRHAMIVEASFPCRHRGYPLLADTERRERSEPRATTDYPQNQRVAPSMAVTRSGKIGICNKLLFLTTDRAAAR